MPTSLTRYIEQHIQDSEGRFPTPAEAEAIASAFLSQFPKLEAVVVQLAADPIVSTERDYQTIAQSLKQLQTAMNEFFVEQLDEFHFSLSVRRNYRWTEAVITR